MADPFSITVGIISICKETYTIGKYIYDTVQAAKQSDIERKRAGEDISHELVILATFERWFSKADGNLVDDELINEVG